MSDVDGLIRRYVIGDRDPRDPAASRNGVKTRTYGLMILALWVPAALSVHLPLPTLADVALIGGVAFVTMRRLTQTVNDVGDEWTRREDRIRARAIPDRDPPDGGGRA